MDAQEKIKAQLNENDVMLYMKGSAMFPQCGFSGKAIEILKALSQSAKFLRSMIISPALSASLSNSFATVSRVSNNSWPEIRQLPPEYFNSGFTVCYQ